MSTTQQDGGKSPKVTHHFGRGGAGNVTAKPDNSPRMPPSSTPTLKSKNYTTGRGGTGNIVENKDPEEARIAQDVDVPGITLPENEYHTGRGGAANTYKPSEEEAKAARENNERLRKDSFSGQTRSGLKGLADKGKEILKGKKDQESK